MVRFMDDAIAVPGTRLRFGWDAVLGFAVPGVGDAITAVSQVILIWSGFRAGVPRSVLARMLLNAAIDAAGGSVPLLGDVFDASYKANLKNLELIERVERDPLRRATIADYAVLAAVIVAVLAVVALPVVIAVWVAATLLRSG
jgi:hypothetical protein